MATVDTVRALFTYLIALVVVVGGGLIIFFSYADESASDLLAITAGFIGSALTFVFGSEVQTRTARQAATATANAAFATERATSLAKNGTIVNDLPPVPPPPVP